MKRLTVGTTVVALILGVGAFAVTSQASADGCQHLKRWDWFTDLLEVEEVGVSAVGGDASRVDRSGNRDGVVCAVEECRTTRRGESCSWTVVGDNSYDGPTTSPTGGWGAPR